MTNTSLPTLQESPKICNLSTGIGHRSNGLTEISQLAAKASNQLANLTDYESVKHLVIINIDLWHYVQTMDRPNGPDHEQIIKEIHAGWRLGKYMPDAPDDETRAAAAASSTARALTALCQLMAEGFQTMAA